MNDQQTIQLTMRASDRDRQQVVDRLRGGLEEGCNTRLSQVRAAMTPQAKSPSPSPLVTADYLTAYAMSATT